jgi:hypothetical protein
MTDTFLMVKLFYTFQIVMAFGFGGFGFVSLARKASEQIVLATSSHAPL